MKIFGFANSDITIIKTDLICLVLLSMKMDVLDCSPVIDILNFGLTWIGLDIDLVFEKHTWIGKGFSSSFLAQHG